MTPASRTTLLDIVPRCILGQLVRDVLRRLVIAKEEKIEYSMFNFRTDLFLTPAGRWVSKNEDALCTEYQSIEWMLPHQIANLLLGWRWTVEVGGCVSITKVGEDALKEIQMDLAYLSNNLWKRAMGAFHGA